MKRKVVVMSAVMMLLMVFAYGCTYGSYSVRMGSEHNTKTSMSMSYEKFNGNKNRVIKLDEDETCEVFVNIVTDSGSIGLSITDEGGNSYYEGNDLPTSNFSVVLDKESKYTIKVEGDKHSGSYDISWEVQ